MPRLFTPCIDIRRIIIINDNPASSWAIMAQEQMRIILNRAEIGPNKCLTMPREYERLYILKQEIEL